MDECDFVCGGKRGEIRGLSLIFRVAKISSAISAEISTFTIPNTF
jgi:hypothetical protein